MGTYERKTREIKRSLHRRARMRRAYFKMIGEDPKRKQEESRDAGEHADAEAASKLIDEGAEIDLSDVSGSDVEEEANEKSEITRKPKNSSVRDRKTVKSDNALSPAQAEPKLTGRQLARRRRAEEYHHKKEKEENLLRAQHRREAQKHTMMKRSTRGQPKLGSQVGVLLDKIRRSGA